VLATPGWRVDAFRVIGDVDQSGSDHRPVVATLTPVG
jgi:endonuclease/exonuclease/phosphatase family metal-dependent hydrolase